MTKNIIRRIEFFPSFCYNPGTSEADIATGVGVALTSVKYWLEHFRKNGTIDEYGHVIGDAIQYLSQKGLA